MTRADVVQRLWDFINSSPAKDGAGATIINAEARAILEACNASLQEIAHYAPRDFFKQTRSSVLRAPLSASIDVTEDSKSFTNLRLSGELGVGSTATNSVLSCSNHGLSVGDRVKFYGTLPTSLNHATTYYVKTTPSANEFTVSSTDGGTAIAMSSSTTFNGYSVITNLPEGCSIEIGGSDEVMRIKTVEDEAQGAPIESIAYLSAGRQFYLKDLDNEESWQRTIKKGDTVAFADAGPGISSGSIAVGTSYYVNGITSLGSTGIGSSQGADNYQRYITLGTGNGTGNFTPTSDKECTLVKTTNQSSNAQGTFHEEYLGTTGTKSCTIYYDAVELNTKVTEVLGTVTLNDESVLTPLMNNDQSSRMHRDRLDQSERFGEYGSGWELPGELQDKEGTPSYYYIDSEHNEITNGQNYYLRVRPFPEKKARLRFTASVLPEKWVISDTYSNTGQIKDTGCPAEYDETILMPFVYKNFTKFIGFDVLPSEGSLQSGNILLQIDEDYRQAIEILKELEPQSERQAVYGVAW
jgi:hypothetical protein